MRICIRWYIGKCSGQNLTFVDLFQMIDSCTHICEQQIESSDCSHAFHDYDGTRNDNRIMTAFDGNVDLFAGLIHSLLCLADGRGRLDGNAEYNR